MSRSPSLLRRLFAGLWRLLTWFRLALSNLLFIGALVLIYFLYFADTQKPLPPKAALLVNPVGVLVEEKRPLTPLEALAGPPGPADSEVLLRDVLDAIRLAADDPAITALVIEPELMMGAGLSRHLDIAAAVETFRASGKPVIAVADYFTQDQYLMASQADEILMHPLGAVALEGFASYRNHFAEALDKLSVSMHVFRAGEHKSMAEPFLRNDMSPAEKAITERWLSDLWGQYTTQVEARRGLADGSVDAYVANYPEGLAAVQGDTARLALETGLVDQLLSHEQSNEYLVERVGAANEDGLYEAVGFQRYVAHKRPPVQPGPEGERIAVIVAEGNILPGDQPPGSIGGDSLTRLLHATAEREDVSAIVLRINSGGGSAFASELIYQAIADIRADGLPVVASMGPLAASGGYYIAAGADRVLATPATLTGSIGVFAAFPTFEKLLERAGVNTDGVGTTPMAGAVRLDRPLQPELASTLQHTVDFTYRTFLERVAQGRDLSLEAVAEVAEGRVWSAGDALEHGLVDQLGSLEAAIAEAGALAGIEQWGVEYVQPPLSPREMLLQQLAQRAQLWLPGLLSEGVGSSWLRAASGQASASVGLPAMLGPLRQAADQLAGLSDPRHLYMQCSGCMAP